VLRVGTTACYPDRPYYIHNRAVTCRQLPGVAVQFWRRDF